MITLTGCTASDGQVADPDCRVVGDTKLLPTLSKAAICSRFLTALDAGLRQSAEPGTLRAGWRFQLSVNPPGVATAILSHSDIAHAIDINIAVSDRPLDGYAIDLLGAAVARRLVTES